MARQTTPPAGYPTSSRPGGAGSRAGGDFYTGSSSDDRFTSPNADPNVVADPSSRAPGFNFVTQAGTRGSPGYSQDDVLSVYSWSPDQIFQLQLQLQMGGWISGDIGQPGVWDGASQDAFRDLLVYANGLGVYFRDALEQSIAAYEAGSAIEGTAGYDDRRGGQGGGALTVQMPNPDDVRRSIEQTVRDNINVDLGEDWYRQKTEEYLDAYRDHQLREGEANRLALLDAERSEGVGVQTYTQGMTAETFIEKELKEERPGLVRTAEVGDAEATVVDAFTRSYG
jgi:hypothetical protein